MPPWWHSPKSAASEISLRWITPTSASTDSAGGRPFAFGRAAFEHQARGLLRRLRDNSPQHFVQAVRQEVGVVLRQAHRRLDAQHVAVQAALAQQQAALLAALDHIGCLRRRSLPPVARPDPPPPPHHAPPAPP